MIKQEIIDNAPDGATHYDTTDGYVKYFKKKSKRSKYMKIYNNGSWYDTFLCMTSLAKPLK